MAQSRLRVLFEHALTLAEPQRKEWLDEICEGDTFLREQVESLLANHGDKNDPLLQIVRDAARAIKTQASNH